MKIIFETLAGSHLYGTGTPTSDKDFRGVCVRSQRERDDPFNNFEQMVQTKKVDRVIYDLRKFFKLATDCNPNIIELLYAPNDAIIHLEPEGALLMAYRGYFLSQKCRNTFLGYAISQLKRIKLHREWLLNPPDKKPERKDFGLPEMPPFALEKCEVLTHAPPETIKDEWKEYALNEQRYRSAKQRWDNHENWEKNRNPKRAELEAKYLFDCKHGMHLYRLMTQGIELLETGHIQLPLSNRDLLLEIRNGKFSYDELMEMVDGFETKLKEIPSDLPVKPNANKIRDLYYEILGV